MDTIRRRFERNGETIMWKYGIISLANTTSIYRGSTVRKYSKIETLDCFQITLKTMKAYRVQEFRYGKPILPPTHPKKINHILFKIKSLAAPLLHTQLAVPTIKDYLLSHFNIFRGNKIVDWRHLLRQ